MIVSNYSKLFSIEFLHDYYRDVADAFRNAALQEAILRDINIIPDEPTMQLTKDYRLQFKNIQNKLFCFVQTIAQIDNSTPIPTVNLTNKPQVEFDENAVLNFNVYLNAPGFYDNSNLRQFYTRSKILKFSNTTGNKRAGQLSLSNKIPAYKTSETYKPGMLALNAGNQAFEAIKGSSPPVQQDTAQAQYWSPVTDNIPFVNQADLSDNTSHDTCFALISISLQKNLPNDFGLLRKSAQKTKDNTILGKDYIIHFKDKGSE